MKVINIVWETDGVSVKELNLPIEVNVPENIDTENIANFLSDEYGYLVKSFEIESDSRKEYCLEMANTIWKSIFQSVEKEVVMSWGVSQRIATWFQNMPALLFCVNGFIHKGSVVITYNEGVDYYEIYFFDKKVYLVYTKQQQILM